MAIEAASQHADIIGVNAARATTRRISEPRICSANDGDQLLQRDSGKMTKLISTLLAGAFAVSLIGAASAGGTGNGYPDAGGGNGAPGNGAPGNGAPGNGAPGNGAPGNGLPSGKNGLPSGNNGLPSGNNGLLGGNNGLPGGKNGLSNASANGLSVGGDGAATNSGAPTNRMQRQDGKQPHKGVREKNEISNVQGAMVNSSGVENKLATRGSNNKKNKSKENKQNKKNKKNKKNK
jgi:hypothetical protein